MTDNPMLENRVLLDEGGDGGVVRREGEEAGDDRGDPGVCGRVLISGSQKGRKREDAPNPRSTTNCAP
jgi:hypothetical protein